MIRLAMLPGVSVREGVFSEEQMARLGELGAVQVQTGAQPDKEGTMAVIRDADIAITSWGCPQLDRDILDCAPNLKLVVHAAGTVKGIVSPEFAERGIRVSSGNGALGIGVAETALGLTIASLKNMWQLAGMTRQGEWNKGKDRIREVYGVTVGVVGGGRAGRHYMKLMRQFEVRLLVYDPVMTAEQARELGAEKAELDELLAQADVVSIHAPSLPETYRMFNSRTFGLMKDDAVLINTARGSLIDEDALVEELSRGRLFACIDVTDPEPPRADHPFRTLPNVVLLPHIAGAVNNGKLRIGAWAVEEIRRYLAGEPLEGEVNLAHLHQLA
ncbi:glycerate dehydrogenase [Paenibacillus sp. J31TS4]|uniref:hydroxyacid dehydrogenase n=1 Tax=Paenibacillus sp. J31TS4 TaxID=2807195 RepID=UPI001B12E4D7|nr:hydroxyacid dehydrogenase [Paenibacillus sp. J31TS4]GIP38008.1 glycerate dehydrogenase [Paenibacillus sp. J31TS4]